MKRITGFILLLLLGLVTPGNDVQFGGFVQTWFSYGQQNDGNPPALGFTFRRVRFHGKGAFSNTVDWYLAAGWDRENPNLTAARITFRLAPQLQFSIGKFPVPGSPSGSLTDSSRLDFVERPMIIQRWGELSRLDEYRSVGIQVDGALMENRIYYALMVFNPDAAALFNPSVKNHAYTGGTAIQYAGRIEVTVLEGIRFGGFFLQGKDTRNDVTNESFGIHGFYRKQAVNARIEYLFGENRYAIAGSPLEYRGLLVKMGYRIQTIEPVIRFDEYREQGAWGLITVKRTTNLTLGINYRPGPHLKLQANYVVRDESMVGGLAAIKNNLFYANLQYSL